MNELDRQDDELLEGEYLDVVDVDEMLREVAVWMLTMSLVVDGLERRGIAPAATRAMRLVLPRVDLNELKRRVEAAASH